MAVFVLDKHHKPLMPCPQGQLRVVLKSVLDSCWNADGQEYIKYIPSRSVLQIVWLRKVLLKVLPSKQILIVAKQEWQLSAQRAQMFLLFHFSILNIAVKANYRHAHRASCASQKRANHRRRRRSATVIVLQDLITGNGEKNGSLPVSSIVLIR